MGWPGGLHCYKIINRQPANAHESGCDEEYVLWDLSFSMFAHLEHTHSVSLSEILWYDQLRFVSLCEETCFEVVNPVNFVPDCGIARIAQNLHVLSVLYLNFTSTCHFGTISESAWTIREKPCTAVVFWIAARISCKEKGWRRGDSWTSCCQVSCAGTWLLYPTLCRDYLSSTYLAVGAVPSSTLYRTWYNGLWRRWLWGHLAPN